MTHPTTSNIEDAQSLQQFSEVLEQTSPRLGFLGGRRYSVNDSRKTVSLHTIVSKFESLCRTAPKGSVSEREVKALRGRIIQLHQDGSKLVKEAPLWKRILTQIFRIANIRFLFKSPVTTIEQTTARFSQRNKEFLDEIIGSTHQGTISQEQCNQITSPALYQELIARLIENKPENEAKTLLDQLYIPRNEDAFKKIRDEALATLSTADMRRAREYIQRLSQEPQPDEAELKRIKDFFAKYIPRILAPQKYVLSHESLEPILDIQKALSHLPNSRYILKAVLGPFSENLADYFCLMMDLRRKGFESGREDLVDLTHDLQLYYLLLEDLSPSLLSKNPAWKNIQEDLKSLYDSFFSQPRVFDQRHLLNVTARPQDLSKDSSFSQKGSIQDWLRSLPEASPIIRDFSRELGNGFILIQEEGQKKITKEDLEASPLIAEILKNQTLSDDDRKCVLCWLAFQVIVTDFRAKGIQNAEEAVRNLLTASVQDRPSYPFLPELAMQAGQQVLADSTIPHDFTFFCDGTTPSLRVHVAYTDEERQVPFTIALRVQKEAGTFTEHIESTPISSSDTSR